MCHQVRAAPIIKSLAAYMAVSSSLTALDLSLNPLRDAGASVLAAGAKESKTLRKLDVSWLMGSNGMSTEGKAAFRAAMQGREDFELEI